jgi:antitoxin component YwqK of YwqJK toxin-antitoxin module
MKRFFPFAIFLSLLCFLTTYICVGQENKKSERQKNFTRDSIPELDLTPDTLEQTSQKKKKVKKRVFYGLKCKKGFTRAGKRQKQVIETFFYLKKPQQPDPYIKDIYVWDIKERKVIEIDELNPADYHKYKILHGPYKKTVGGNTVELGIFYIGTKHARWEKFDKNFVLLDKTRFYKGWQKDAQISYYDAERKKIKEVLPYKFGELNGTYYYFLENGQVFHHGKYKDDKKIGLWVEYYKDKNRRRKEVQYPKGLYIGEQFEPYTLNEWNDKGDPIIKGGKPFDPAKARRKTTRQKK